MPENALFLLKNRKIRRALGALPSPPQTPCLQLLGTLSPDPLPLVVGTLPPDLRISPSAHDEFLATHLNADLSL